MFYTSAPNTTHTLIVNGLIENVRGCDSADYIAGNEANNLIFGDQAASGIGGNDTLNGADGNDTAYGGSGLDVLYGGAGNDKLYGDGGNDSIAGDAGADTVEGGAGADTLSGGSEVGDTVSYAKSGSGVTINITYGVTTAGLVAMRRVTRSAAFLNVLGSAGADTITDTNKGTIAFGYNNNLFDGAAGNDLLTMGGGNDTAIGGAGDDTLSGEDGRDKLLGGLDDDQILMGAGNDAAYGGAGNDTMQGDGGMDRLYGGLGADQQSGGGGADRFIFTNRDESTTTAAGRDTIADFKHGQGDKIDLSGMDAILSTPAVNDSFTFRSAALGFSGAGAEVTYVAIAGGIRVLADSDANGIADFAITLTGHSVHHRAGTSCCSQGRAGSLRPGFVQMRPGRWSGMCSRMSSPSRNSPSRSTQATMPRLPSAAGLNFLPAPGCAGLDRPGRKGAGPVVQVDDQRRPRRALQPRSRRHMAEIGDAADHHRGARPATATAPPAPSRRQSRPSLRRTGPRIAACCALRCPCGYCAVIRTQEGAVTP